MAKYLIKRVLTALFTLLVIATITFFLLRAIPGGPFTREKPLPDAIIRALNEKYNLDEPLFIQYLSYIKGLLTFDLGPSYRILGYTVNDIIISGFPTSALIGGIASLLIVVIGIPLGIVSALKQNSPVDYMVMFMATLGVTVPNFIIATLIIYIFSTQLGWLPSNGISNPLGYIGPVIALMGYSLSFVSRLTRSSMLEVLRQDYVRTARANGISERKVIFKHALKNALIPVITYVGPMVAAILTGSFVVEKIFAIPGIGRYFVQGVTNRDYTVIMGMTVLYSAFYIFMILLVDLAYSWIDPRIRLEGGAR
ncbi:MAG: ABC transporter permease [Candidatus Izimaplasma sp.]|nr:ABC transporter permease [Candidatus Izimaplasma bacterium]